MMRANMPQSLLDDLTVTLDASLKATGIVNVSLLAEEVRRRNAEANVAREDIERTLLYFAQQRSAAIEFDNPSFA